MVLECVEDKFLTQLVSEPTKEAVPLDLLYSFNQKAEILNWILITDSWKIKRTDTQPLVSALDVGTFYMIRRCVRNESILACFFY